MKLDTKQLAQDRHTLDLILDAARSGHAQTLLASEIEALERIHAVLNPGQASDTPTMRTFKSAYLRDELDLPGGENELKSWVIEEQDHLTLHGLIFRTEDQPNGYAWQTTFTVGNDDDEAGPWEHETEVECMLVRLGTKITNVWLPAKMKP